MRSIIGLKALWLAAGSWCLVAVLGTELDARTTIYIVRHAEKEKSDSKDPPLAAAGRERAQALQRTLRSVPLRAIYTTQYQRTQQTAAPLARSAKVKPKVLKTTARKALARALRTQHDGEHVLVVGHSFTLPYLFKEFGVKEKIAFNVEKDYDHLFIMILGDDGKVESLLHLHFGAPSSKPK